MQIEQEFCIMGVERADFIECPHLEGSKCIIAIDSIGRVWTYCDFIQPSSIEQAYRDLLCPINTKIENSKECLKSYPVLTWGDYMACPLMSGTESRPCVYEGPWPNTER